MKHEIIATLPEAEARAVMVAAADTSKAAAQVKMRGFVIDEMVDVGRLAQWCEASIKPMIKRIMAAHDFEHAREDAAIARARR